MVATRSGAGILDGLHAATDVLHYLIAAGICPGEQEVDGYVEIVQGARRLLVKSGLRIDQANDVLAYYRSQAARFREVSRTREDQPIPECSGCPDIPCSCPRRAR